MLSKLFYCGLTSIVALSIVTSISAADQDLKPGVAVEVHTLQLGAMELKAEEIDFKIQRDGKHLIKLEGRASIKFDEFIVSADTIEASHAKKKDVVINLTGNVEIVSKADQFRAKALSANIDFGKKLLSLKSGEGKHVTLTQSNGSKTFEIEASQIQLSFQDSDSMFLKTLGSLKLNEKKVKFNTKPAKRRPTNNDQFGPAGDFFKESRLKNANRFGPNKGV
ncbi:MAG: hypothetical protein QM501_07310, partial [Gimesia sp.]